MKQFLKSTEVTVKNGGYLFNNQDKPVSNKEFENAQKHAEFIIKFREEIKGKDFVGKTPDNINSIRKSVLEKLEKDQKIVFVEGPKKVEQTLNQKLAKEALDFIKFHENTSKTEKVNDFLQKFKVVKQFEEFGLFFEEDVAELNKIYTLKEIVEAVTEIIEHI